MAPSIIFFLKEGSKIKLANGRTTTVDHSRLHVGYCKRDWTKVFYEPSSDTEVRDDEVAVPAIYRNNFLITVEGNRRREPAEGEIAWLPHFDPNHIQNTVKKEREAIHKQTMNDAWIFLDAADEDFEELKVRYKDEKHRRWDSWFVEAVKWKESRVNTRLRRLARRRADMFRAGEDPNGAHSDTSDDSAYESDGDGGGGGGGGMMAPPPGPVPRRAQPNGRSSASNRARPNVGTKRRRQPSPLGSSDGGSSTSMLGRRRPGQSSRARGRPSGLTRRPGPFQRDSSDDEGNMFMSGGSGSASGRSNGGSNNLPGGLLRNARAASASSGGRSFTGQERLFSETSDIYDTRAPENGTPQAMPQDDGAWLPEDTIAAYQGDMNEDDAYRRAVRVSEAREVRPTPEAYQGDMDEHTALQFAIDASQAQEALPTPRATGTAPMQGAEDDLNGMDPDLAAAMEASRALQNRHPQPTSEDAGDVELD